MPTIETFNDLLAAFQATDAPAGWVDAWDKHRALSVQIPAFWAASYIEDTCDFCAFSAEVRAAFQAGAAAVRGDAGLARMAAFLYGVYYADPMPEPAAVFGWPNVAQPLPDPAAMIPALVLLAGVPRLRAAHEARGIPAEVTRDAMRDLAIWMGHFRRHQGYWGLQNMGWPTNTMQARLFRLGRLQFIHKRFDGPVSVFQHRDGRVTALWSSDIALRRDGYVDGTNDVFDKRKWTAMFTRDDEVVSGYPVHPKGYVLPAPVTLPLTEWQPALLPGDGVLDIHIPEDGRMDFDDCGASLREAVDFFARYFPEKPRGKAFVCGTWFFDAQYQQILPPFANIVRFQREFSLWPMLSYDREPFWRVFGDKPADFAAAPRDTALRRAMLDFAQAGGQLRCAGGFCLIDGMNWGSARYQREDTE